MPRKPVNIDWNTLPADAFVRRYQDDVQDYRAFGTPEQRAATPYWPGGGKAAGNGSLRDLRLSYPADPFAIRNLPEQGPPRKPRPEASRADSLPRYWEDRHEPVECLDSRDCVAQLTARRAARDRHNGTKPEWQALIMKGAFGDDGTIRRPVIVEKKRRWPKVLRDHGEWCQDMAVDVANSLWARPSFLRGAGEGMPHKLYDEVLNNELERMRAFDDNKLVGRPVAKVITEMPLSLAPKFAKDAKPNKKAQEVFGKYLKDSPTEAEQLDAVRLLADYHAICEHRRWGK